jgi:outer membrane protein TolC
MTARCSRLLALVTAASLLAVGSGMARVAVAQPPAAAPEVLEIDLAAALRLADERNLDVAIFLERVAEASAVVARARTFAIPSLRVGATRDRHEGTIQETSGQVVDIDRASRFRGVGTSLSVDIADAIYAPLAAKQTRAAVAAAASANRHRVLLDVAAAYLRLLHARAEGAIVDGTLARAEDLAELTANYAEAGEGLLADAEMAAVQPLLWGQRRLQTDERLATSAAQLQRLLHLPGDVTLEPREVSVPSLEIFSPEEDVAALIARALDDRPETDQYDALVAAAESDLDAQRLGLFVPTVSLDYSTGDFGGGPGSTIANTGDRDDLALGLRWQFEALGFGHRARMDEKRAQLRRVGLERERLHDAIEAEVREAAARVRSFAAQRAYAEQAVTGARLAYDLNRDRIYDQQALPLEALQAMQTLAQAELAQLDTELGYALAQLRLFTAVGSPLDSEIR